MDRSGNGVGRRQYIKYVGGASVLGTTGLAGCTQDGGNSGGSGGQTTQGGGGETSGGDGGSNVQQPVSLTMSSFKEGTGWYVMAGAISDAVSQTLPQASQISVRPFGGSIGTIKLLGQNKADVGLNHPVTVGWATEGKYVFDKKYSNLRAIMGHMDTYWVLIAARQASTNFTTFKEIKEQQPALRVGAGPTGGVANTGVQHAFEANGITYDDIRSWGGKIVRMGLGDMPSAMSNGDIDIMGWVGTPGHPTWTEVANSVKLNFLPLDDKAKQNMVDKGWMDMPAMPEGTFDNQQPIPSVGWRTEVLTDTDMSDSVARAFAKGIVENQDQIRSAYSAFKVFDPAKAGKMKYTGVPLHPGAKSYLQDQGYI